MIIRPGQQLLIEHFAGTLSVPDRKILKEYHEEIKDTGGLSRPVVVVGVIQRADSKNQNGRIYPYEVLKNETDRYKSEVIDGAVGSRALGELDHEETPIIHLRNASHILDDIWWDGPQNKEVWGKIRLLNTPNGDIAKKIALDSIPLGISSRAVGSVDEKHDASYVKDDLQLICWDLVGTPSTNGAYLSPHKEMSENVKVKVNNKSYKLQETLKDILQKRK